MYDKEVLRVNFWIEIRLTRTMRHGEEAVHFWHTDLHWKTMSESQEEVLKVERNCNDFKRRVKKKIVGKAR